MKVSIEATQDGQYLVEVEQDAPTMGQPGVMQEEGAMDASGENEQAFATLDEAIEAARAALGGEDGGQKPMIEGEDAFVAGYKRARGGEGQGF